MTEHKILCAGREIPVYALDTVVIGTGCAGYNAADSLFNLGRTDVAIITEGVKMGTSRNTGSDKQTYYKLSLCADAADSVQEMAETLFDGGSVHGDTALAEAAGSVRSFMKLVELGVPFPCNAFGEYAGYKTDHDPRQRATSAGPLTSRFMTEALERSVQQKQIPIFNQMQAVRLLVWEGNVFGLLALDLTRPGMDGLTLFAAEHIILATGDPAGIYHASVYPYGHTGMAGMALEAGAKMNNLQEWQYGLASVDFRWNVSGTYQQVLPRYISVDADGVEREFLQDYFDTPQQALDAVFLKGYQWPFDVRKIDGSSMIDLIVQHETIDLHRTVYMDFRTNPSGLEHGFDGLSEETYTYLENSGALLPTPIERLHHMNPDAIELYRAHGIDLYTQPLRIAMCAQHCNGGVAVDANWQSSIGGLYAAGECAGTFGIYRPGGSALNATQVGSMRAAEHIAFTSVERQFDPDAFAYKTAAVLDDFLKTIQKRIEQCDPESRSYTIRKDMQQRMSASAAHIRNVDALDAMRSDMQGILRRFWEEYVPAAPGGLAQMLKTRDLLITQAAVLSSMSLSARTWGSRGSGLVTDHTSSPIAGPSRDNHYRTASNVGRHQAIETVWQENDAHSAIVPVRPIPQRDDWFENVWRDYRARTEKPRA